MNIKSISVTRLAVAVLLVGIAAAGCGSHRGASTEPPAAAATAAQPSQVVQTAPTLAPTTAELATDAPPLASTVPVATGAPVATPDPLDGELSNIENQLNSVNGSLSGADAGSQGGE